MNNTASRVAAEAARGSRQVAGELAGNVSHLVGAVSEHLPELDLSRLPELDLSRLPVDLSRLPVDVSRLPVKTSASRRRRSSGLPVVFAVLGAGLLAAVLVRSRRRSSATAAAAEAG